MALYEGEGEKEGGSKRAEPNLLRRIHLACRGRSKRREQAALLNLLLTHLACRGRSGHAPLRACRFPWRRRRGSRSSGRRGAFLDGGLDGGMRRGQGGWWVGGSVCPRLRRACGLWLWWGRRQLGPSVWPGSRLLPRAMGSGR